MFLNDQRGAALVTVMVVILIITVLGTAMLSLSSTEKNISRNQLEGQQAFYLAEAAINKSLALLNAQQDKRDFSGEFDDFPLFYGGEGSAQVSVLNETADTLALQAIGRINMATKTINVEFLKPVFSSNLVIGTSGLLEIKSNWVIESDIVHDGDVIIENKAKIDGNLIASGNVTNDGTITGNVTAGGTVQNNGTIGGSIAENQTVTIPNAEPDMAWYADNADHVIIGDQSVTVEDINAWSQIYDIVYIQGNLTFSHDSHPPNYTGSIVVAVDGNVVVDSNLKPDGTGVALAIIASGDIDVKNYEIEGLFQAGGTFYSNGNPEIDGVVVCSAFDIKGQLDLEFEPSFLSILSNSVYGAGFQLTNWKEL